jgi:Flp pilus assembly protein TadD
MESFDEAIEKFEKAVEISPSHPSAWYGWGIALNALGLKEAAAEKIKKAMSFDPDS